MRLPLPHVLHGFRPRLLDAARDRDGLEHARRSLSDARGRLRQSSQKEAIDLLNHAVATEIVCILRYKFHAFCAVGLASESVKRDFLEHAKEEEEHLDALAERINQLGGKPNLNDPISVIDRVEPVDATHMARPRIDVRPVAPRPSCQTRRAPRIHKPAGRRLGPPILPPHVLDRFARPFEVLLR